ncbi:hypothetical protein SteCoe_16195 [Stentor coeruleus]|uniref:Sodium/calcium exchanger membrane region domain-containing protein n=1 Tax=Stentor coeruleus TaxID=5963 RepID=A0A1R2C1Q0_9CILI|nr:hypothetical protein SteCoe_16195 [Stentor coeruleus]
MKNKLILLLSILPIILSEKHNPRRVEALPNSAFTDDEIRKGGLILYIIGIAYVFLCIREICSQYFIPSIDHVVEKYKIKPEVAGATMLALGGSAPEIFIMFFATFLAGGEIGHSTILGSGAINGMLLIGICGLSASANLELQWWLVVRDSIFNLIFLALLIVFTANSHVSWWEGFILLICYLFYAIFMYYNQLIERNFKKYLNLPYDGDDIDYHPLPERSFPIRRYSVTELVNYIPPQLNFKKGVLAKMIRNSQLQVVKGHSERLMELRARLKNVIYIILQAIEEKKRCLKQNRLERGVIQKFNGEYVKENNNQEEIISRIRKLESLRTQEPNPIQLVEVLPRSSRLKHYFLLPVILLLRITVPNVRKCPSLWLLSMLSSLIWIGFYSFLVVWWVMDLGRALSIPDGILGIIILAAGVSIPDIVNTLMKTLEGSGEMALSGCLGSNIINFSVGIGLPWFLHGAITGNNLVIKREIFFTEIVLISTLGASYIFIGGFKWKLSKNLGVVMIFYYLVFLLLFLLLEFNQI